MTTDEQLILDFQRGSQAAFAELFDRYRQPVFGFFRRRLHDAARAEELAQETFLVVLRGIERYEPRATFRTYLYSIAFKQASGEYRRAKHDPVPISTEPAAAPQQDSCDALWVRRAVEKLDEQHREVLLLREYEQLQLRRNRGAPANSSQHSSFASFSRPNGIKGITRSRTK